MRPARGRARLTLALGTLLLLARSPGRAEPTAAPDEWIPFEANWSAAGREHALSMGDREAATLELSGPFLVTSGEGLGRGFRADAIAFVERGRVGIGRLVLTDEEGDQIFNDLRGQAPGTGKRIQGTITGGTGRYTGLEGSFAFDWRYLLHTDEGTIQGRAVDLKGRYRRRPHAPSAAPAEGGH